MIHSTYFAGFPSGITVDAKGNAYIAGGAGPGFLVTPGAFQTVTTCPPNFDGYANGFVSKIWPLAITPAPSVTSAPTTLNFSETVVGASKTLEVTLTNT